MEVKKFTVATWNVNSIKVRAAQVLDFCARTAPDVLCLQELKCETDNFPVADFEAAGYHSAIFGQRQYNGVAVLSRREPSAVHEVSMVAGDSAARWVQIEIGGLHIVSLYAPNGNEVGSDKYAYKLSWYAQARRYLQQKFKPAQDSVVLTGDFNVAPADIDVHDPKLRAGKILCSQPERDAWQSICALGYHDFLRHKYPQEVLYSWWDYRHLSFPQNKGFRIDFTLVSSALLPRCRDAWIERNERKKRGEMKPSDHVPVVLALELESGKEPPRAKQVNKK